MAFASNNASQPARSITEGPAISEVDTELIGFTALAQGSEGAAKLKLLPTPWPSDNLPPSSASLLCVASMRGLLAAVSPDTLTVSSTANVRKAFLQKPGAKDVIEDFKPDLVMSIPQPRHVAFSADEEYLILCPEKGGLHIYNVDALLDGNTKPERQIDTNNDSVRGLFPNPDADLAHYAAFIGDSGRLEIADITTGTKLPIKNDGATCASWSVRGKAYAVGYKDGTAAVFLATDTQIGTIPRPPTVEDGWAVSNISYLGNDDFFVIHCPLSPSDDGEPEEAQYNFVQTKFLKKETPKFKDFTFRRFDYDAIFPQQLDDSPSRPAPTRFSVSRLRKWEPILEDMLILSRSNSSEMVIVANTSDKISPEQEVVNEYMMVLLQDVRRPSVPRQSLGEDLESAPIGEVLDLSGTDKVPRPAKRLSEEVEESPGPLPAYMVLTSEGILGAWWVVWDKALEKGTSYPGLTAVSGTARPAPKFTAPKPQSPSLFSQPASNTPSAKTTSPFTQPSPGATSSTPTFGSTGVSSTPFGKPAQPAFGQTSTPAFGQPSKPAFGQPSTPAFGQPSKPAFGQPSTPAFGQTSKPAFGQTSQPAFGQASQPAFGSTSQIGGTAFGAAGSASQTSAQTKPNPFGSATGSTSGFGQLGSGKSNAPSPFTSFGSAYGGSPFNSLPAKPAFSGTSNGFKGLSTEPSFGGETINLTDSRTSSWANTPGQQSGSAFSSFASNTDSNTSGKEHTDNRERDEATPTPQAPPTQAKQNIFGLPAGGFKLGSTFANENASAKGADGPGTSGGSLFDNSFTSALPGSNSKAPVTPQQEKGPEEFSTTPATQPKSNLQFPGGMSTSAPKSENDLPPIAGSPPVQVEAPSSSVPSSPLHSDEGDEEESDAGSDEGEEEEEEDSEEDQTGDISVEEQDDEDGEETTEFSPSDAARKSRPAQSGWSFQDSAHQSPRIPPAAPTPPPAFSQPFKPGSTPFAQPPKGSPLSFGQSAAPKQSSLFGGSSKPNPFSSASQPKTGLRPSSGMRGASDSVINHVRREPLPGSGSSLSASIQYSSGSEAHEPEVTDLVDDDDERIRRELASDIVPCRTLDPFIARQEYNGAALNKTGHAAQIEILYRDINNMVDTLGLNFRSLESFVDYHKQPHRDNDLSLDDLRAIEEQGEDGRWFEEWTHAEMDDLKILESQLEQQLDEGRVHSVFDKVNQLHRLTMDSGKLSTKINGVRRELVSRKDPDKLEAIRKAPLPKDLADHQKLLRTEYARLLTLLSQAEEAIMLLKSKLASYNAEHGKTGAVPTVDAIKKTINKLIAITEKKNNDITLLESQFRKVGLAIHSRPTSSSSRALGTPARQSRGVRGESPFATPPANRSQVSLSKLNRTALTPEVDATPTKGFGLFYTPEGSPSADRTLEQLGELDDGVLAELREKARRRRKAADDLEDMLVRKGVKQTRVP
ncbi:unnamed protein product [Periconia digitata]|uniref:Nucleoporin Nup159/Nup146 N-terminal domain-containing protein n=1 Tax=Periconia digitata TaxID=1303443 RepID=A0A9W4UQA7_9PLEO|nr:unnamed protein product [Periconia digitata]